MPCIAVMEETFDILYTKSLFFFVTTEPNRMGFSPGRSLKIRLYTDIYIYIFFLGGGGGGAVHSFLL